MVSPPGSPDLPDAVHEVLDRAGGGAALRAIHDAGLTPALLENYIR